MDRRNAHVESIVGPLRASDRRKDRMREELLDHLVAASDAAAARNVVDPVAEAIAQLGPADTLHAELQGSVPSMERTLFTRIQPMARYTDLFGRDPVRENTPFRYAARRAFHMTVFLLPPVLLTLAFVPAPNPTKGAGAVVLILGAFVTSTFTAFWVLETLGLRACMHVRSATPAGRQALILLAFGVLLIGTFLGAVHVVIPGGLGPELGQWIATWPREAAGVITLFFVLVSRGVLKDLSKAKRRYARWGTVPGLPE